MPKTARSAASRRGSVRPEASAPDLPKELAQPALPLPPPERSTDKWERESGPGVPFTYTKPKPEAKEREREQVDIGESAHVDIKGE